LLIAAVKRFIISGTAWCCWCCMGWSCLQFRHHVEGIYQWILWHRCFHCLCKTICLFVHVCCKSEIS